MSWFIFALIATLGWGCADLFYKMGTDETDKHSHLKIAVWVGLVMGIVALILLPFSESGFNLKSLVINAVKYTPASLAYIISMVVGYAGLRYLEVSIISPIQNASGAFSMIAMMIFFLITGTINDDLGDFSILNIIGTVIIIAGVVALAIVENRLSRKEANEVAKSDDEKKKNRKYQFGALALLFPIIYCLFDTIGTAADGIILDEETGLGLGEIDVLILYGLTFLLAGIVCYIFMLIKTKKAYNPFALKELRTKGSAACFEEFGQIFYVFAMASKPMLAAPMIASYCIVSVILSRIFLKEKLKASQYACVIAVIVGIVILGINEGLGEME
ncbi:MAG: EamA family transporter [Lachnospiraceae bacterium]|nr:EamA family transporter [Lachnospiraceae bacterium]